MSNSRTYELKQRAERQQETRRRIVEAAVEIHTTLGPARTTVTAIAERAGVTRPTVYAHFADDHSLFQACSAHVRETHRRPIRPPGARSPVPASAWRRPCVICTATTSASSRCSRTSSATPRDADRRRDERLPRSLTSRRSATSPRRMDDARPSESPPAASDRSRARVQHLAVARPPPRVPARRGSSADAYLRLRGRVDETGATEKANPSLR